MYFFTVLRFTCFEIQFYMFTFDAPTEQKDMHQENDEMFKKCIFISLSDIHIYDARSMKGTKRNGLQSSHSA